MDAINQVDRLARARSPFGASFDLVGNLANDGVVGAVTVANDGVSVHTVDRLVGLLDRWGRTALTGSRRRNSEDGKNGESER